MHATTIVSPSRRQELRRAVDVECGVLSTAFEDVAALSATDLSPLGMWLETDLPLELGESLVVSFMPPRWPSWGSPVVVLAEVVRVGMPRRRADSGQAGMGVRFLDLDPEQEARMRSCLSGMPPVLPSLRARRAERSEEQLVLEDGTCFALCAEAELLTAGRPAPAAPAPIAAALRVMRPRRHCGSHTRLFRMRLPRGTSRRSPRREQPHLAH